MKFRSFNNLRVFNRVASHLSFTAAAVELNLTKGAVSYQMTHLEDDLGFKVFLRRKKGIELTEQGRLLLNASRQAYADLEKAISSIRKTDSQDITIGMSTYFASRWLSPRLMRFMAGHPDINLRIQPLIDLIDLSEVNIDVAIRWGKGNWNNPNETVEQIFSCPAMLSAGKSIYQLIVEKGIEATMNEVKVFHDRDGSKAWQDWFDKADFDYVARKNSLVIPDPNVRVQAVIDNQGVALNDALVNNEVSQGLIQLYSEVILDDYGYYLAYPEQALEQPAVQAFRDWIMWEASGRFEKLTNP